MNFKKELIADVKEKLKLYSDAYHYSFTCPKYAKDVAVKLSNGYKYPRKLYLTECMEKIKLLDRDPITKEQKRIWIDVMEELRSDFGIYHSSWNLQLGSAGEEILRYMFDMPEEREK